MHLHTLIGRMEEDAPVRNSKHVEQEREREKESPHDISEHDPCGTPPARGTRKGSPLPGFFYSIPSELTLT